MAPQYWGTSLGVVRPAEDEDALMDLGAFWAIYFPGPRLANSHDALVSQEKHSFASKVRLILRFIGQPW